jgi:hypothetical protein
LTTRRKMEDKARTKKGKVLQALSDEEDANGLDSDDGQPRRKRRKTAVSDDNDNDNESYDGRDSPVPPRRDDRPPKRKSTGRIYSVMLPVNTDPSFTLDFKILKDNVPEVSEDEHTVQPTDNQSNPLFLKKKDIVTQLPVNSTSGSKGRNDCGDHAPVVSGAAMQPSNKRKLVDDRLNEDQARKKVKFKSTKDARYDLLRPLLEKGTAPSFFLWLDKDYPVTALTVDCDNFEDYIALFDNSVIQPKVPSMDHSMDPAKRLIQTGTTKKFFAWLNDIICVSSPKTQDAAEEMHQLIDAYMLTAGKDI